MAALHQGQVERVENMVKTSHHHWILLSCMYKYQPEIAIVDKHQPLVFGNYSSLDSTSVPSQPHNLQTYYSISSSSSWFKISSTNISASFWLIWIKPRKDSLTRTTFLSKSTSTHRITSGSARGVPDVESWRTWHHSSSHQECFSVKSGECHQVKQKTWFRHDLNIGKTFFPDRLQNSGSMSIIIFSI